MKIRVQETFQQTLQGEGYYSGTPVDFIRLYGCPVGCYFCDQEYAEGGSHLLWSDREIDDLIKELISPRIIISGGEPFIHKNLKFLVEEIIKCDREVGIETAGITWVELPDSVWITLSPKEHLNNRWKVCEQFYYRSNEVKIIIATGNELDYYRGNLLKNPCQNLFLQPEWETRDRTIPITLNLLKQYPTARLSLQTHKYVNIP